MLSRFAPIFLSSQGGSFLNPCESFAYQVKMLEVTFNITMEGFGKVKEDYDHDEIKKYNKETFEDLISNQNEFYRYHEVFESGILRKIGYSYPQRYEKFIPPFDPIVVLRYWIKRNVNVLSDRYSWAIYTDPYLKYDDYRILKQIRKLKIISEVDDTVTERQILQLWVDRYMDGINLLNYYGDQRKESVESVRHLAEDDRQLKEWVRYAKFVLKTKRAYDRSDFYKILRKTVKFKLNDLKNYWKHVGYDIPSYRDCWSFDDFVEDLPLRL